METIKTVAAINDMAGFSRCSLTVAIPILTAMGTHCCPLPTAILSNHTGYESFFFDDYTSRMEAYFAQWAAADMRFDCIYTGFLGSLHQISIVEAFIQRFREEDTLVVVDPVMGDDGKIYSTYTQEMCARMRDLISRADVVTPNVTEACELCGQPYTGEEIPLSLAQSMCERIAKMGCKDVVITGIRTNGMVSTYSFDHQTGRGTVASTDAVPVYYSGTGDVFASVLCGALTNGADLAGAVRTASTFVERAVRSSRLLGIAPEAGVAIETCLGDLVK